MFFFFVFFFLLFFLEGGEEILTHLQFVIYAILTGADSVGATDLTT